MNDRVKFVARGRQADVLSCAIILAISSAYFVGLGRAPIYFGGDEAQFAAHASSIAATGRDLNGRLLPLFVNLTDPLRPLESSGIWYQPMLFYLIALVLKLAPVTEAAARLPTAIIGAGDGLLMYAIGRRLFPHRASALLAALLLLLSPAHFIFARQAVDYLCSLPFVFGWLWCLIAFTQTSRPSYLLAAGLLLGVGVYTYIASWAMMSLYFAATLIMLWQLRVVASAAWVLVIGFALPLLAAMVWFRLHPGMVADTLARYGLQAAHLASSSSVRPSSLASSLIERVSLYWQFFDPSYLFFSGGSNPTMATRRAGVFLLAMSPFLGCGLYELVRRRSPLNNLILFGFLSAPLPVIAALPQSPHTTGRELPILLFAALVSVAGVAALLRSPKSSIRVGVVLLLTMMPVQFGYFLHEYYTEYQAGSAERFDPINMRGVADSVVSLAASHEVPAIYLSDDLDDASIRWRFYTLKYQREDLWARTSLFAADHPDIHGAPVGSLFVTYANNPRWTHAADQETCSLQTVILNATGSPSAAVMRKDR